MVSGTSPANWNVERLAIRLAAVLGHEVDPRVWGQLRKRNNVAQALEDLRLVDLGALGEAEVFDDLLAAYRDLADFGAAFATQGRAVRPRREIPPDRRADALGRIVALDAARWPGVARFRAEILGDKLLAPEKVPAWIAARARKEGEPTRLVTVADDDRGGEPRRIERLTIGYPDAAAGGTVRTFIAEGGSLGRLQRLAVDLSRLFGWAEPDAVAFVLSGLAPPVPLAEAVGVRSRLNYPTLSAVTLTVSARLSPDQVGRLYAAVRRDLLGVGRDRGPGESWKAELSVFTAEHNDGRRTWRALSDEWNRLHPEHAYRDWRAFQRDARRSFEQVTGRRLEWRGRKTTQEEERS